MTQHRSFGKRFSHKKKQYIWATDLTSTTLAAAGGTSFQIVTATRWERSTTSSETCRVRRVVGQLTWGLEDATPVVGSLRAACLLAVADEDALGIGNPAATSGLYDDERAMFSYMGSLNIASATPTNTPIFFEKVDVDWRGRRLLTTG